MLHTCCLTMLTRLGKGSCRFRSIHFGCFVKQNEEVISELAHTSANTHQWTPQSRRTGVIAIKLGMSHLWTKTGYRIPVTLLQIIDNQVIRVKTKATDGYTSLQIGAINHPKPHKLNKATLGQYKQPDIQPKRKTQEFRVTEDATLPVGTELYSGHFVAGQYVDVCGITIGKGFQGVMKRHGMKGQPASHGVTKTHRKMGATGGGGDPGRIWPGKKMPGRMGCKRVTTQSLLVYRINHQFNVLYVKGSVPGHKNNYVRVTDAKRQPHKTPPPFPTCFKNENGALAMETYWEHLHQPHLPSLEFTDITKGSKK